MIDFTQTQGMRDTVEKREIGRFVIEQAEAVQESKTLSSKAKQRSAKGSRAPLHSYESYQRKQERFFLGLRKMARDMELPGKNLEDDQVKMELINKVIGADVVPLAEVHYVYKKVVRVLKRVWNASEDEADRLARDLILRSVERALLRSNPDKEGRRGLKPATHYSIPLKRRLPNTA